MKRLIMATILLCTCFSGPAKSKEAGPEWLSSSISKVTVYSDRASVTRTTSVKLSSDEVVYGFKKLPGWVDDGSVRVTLSPSGAGRIVDVRVKRDYLARATDEEYRKAADAVQEIADKLDELEDEERVLNAQAKQIEEIRVFSMESIPRESAVRDINVESYGKVVNFVTGSLRATAKARRNIDRKRRDLGPELAARQRRLDELQSLTQLEETTVLVTLAGTGAGQGVLELKYMLPGATWEPAHELRAQGRNPNSAEVTSYAVVTQTSGEDWENVDISFSSQSSTEAIRIPELEALTLGDTHVTSRTVRKRQSSFSRAQAAFEGQNRMWNKVQQKKSNYSNWQEMYESNIDILQVTQSKTVEIFKRLQTRGTTAHFLGKGKQTIRGDGHSVRVHIGRTELAARQKIVAAPEQSLNAVRTLQMSNSGSQPFLPGGVALYHDGTFLGMTEVDFIAEGEDFSLFLGVADQIKLSRVLDKKHSSLVRGKRTRMQVAFTVAVENLSDEEISLELADRIPVSENKEIRVDRVKISPKGKPDARGLLHWSLTLPAKGKKSYGIGYRIEYPPMLVLEMERTRKHKQAARRAMPGAPPQAAPAYDFDGDEAISEQIMSLEEAM